MQSWHEDIVIDRLQQIRESVALVHAWCSDYATVDDFLCSATGMAMLDASILRLQIIGESVRAIDDMTQRGLLCRYPDIPWRSIIGLRNIISHDYANVNYALIVGIIKGHLHSLDNCVARIIGDLQQADNPE